MTVPSFNDFLREVTSLGKAETGFNVENELGFSPADYTRAYGGHALDVANPFGYLGRTIAKTFGADIADPFRGEGTPELPLALQLPETLFSPHPLAQHWAEQAPEGWQRSVAQGAAQLTSPFDLAITVGTVGFGAAAAAGLRAAAAGTGAIARNKALRLGAKGAAALVEPLASTGTKSGLARALGLELGTGLAAETGLHEAERHGLPLWAALPVGLASGGAFLGTAMGAKKAINRFGSPGTRTASQMEEVMKFPSDVPPSALPEASEFLFVARNMDEATSMIGEFSRARSYGMPMSKGLDLKDFLKANRREGIWKAITRESQWNERIETDGTRHGKEIGAFQIRPASGLDPSGFDEVVIPLRPNDYAKIMTGKRGEILRDQAGEMVFTPPYNRLRNIPHARVGRIKRAGFAGHGYMADDEMGMPSLVVSPENLVERKVRALDPTTDPIMARSTIGVRLKDMSEVEGVTRRINEILEDTLDPDIKTIDIGQYPETVFGKLRKIRTDARAMSSELDGAIVAPSRATAQLYRDALSYLMRWNRVKDFPLDRPWDLTRETLDTIGEAEYQLIEALKGGLAFHEGTLSRSWNALATHNILDNYIRANEDWALAAKKELEYARDPKKRIQDLPSHINEQGNLVRTTSEGVTITEIKSVEDYVNVVGDLLDVQESVRANIVRFMKPFTEFMAEGFGISEEDTVKNMLLGVADRRTQAGAAPTAMARTANLPKDPAYLSEPEFKSLEGAAKVDPQLHFAPMQSLVEIFRQNHDSSGPVMDIVTLTHEFAHVILHNFLHLLPQEQYDEISRLIKTQIEFTRRTLHPKMEGEFNYSSDQAAKIREILAGRRSPKVKSKYAQNKGMGEEEYEFSLREWMQDPVIRRGVLETQQFRGKRGAIFEYEDDPELFWKIDLLGDFSGSPDNLRARQKAGLSKKLDDIYRQLDIKVIDANSNRIVRTIPWQSQVQEAWAEIFASWMNKKLLDPNYRPDDYLSKAFTAFAKMLRVMLDTIKENLRLYYTEIHGAKKSRGGVTATEELYGDVRGAIDTEPMGMAEGLVDRPEFKKVWEDIEKLLDGVINKQIRPISAPLTGQLLLPANKQANTRRLRELLVTAQLHYRTSGSMPERDRINIARLLLGFDFDEEDILYVPNMDVAGDIIMPGHHEHLTRSLGENISRTLSDDAIDPQQALTPFGVSLTSGEHLRHIWRVLRERDIQDPWAVPLPDEDLTPFARGKGLTGMDVEAIDALPEEAWATRVSMSKALLREIGQLSFSQRNSLEPLYDANYLDNSLERLTSVEAAQADMSGFRLRPRTGPTLDPRTATMEQLLDPIRAMDDGGPTLFFHGGLIPLGRFKHSQAKRKKLGENVKLTYNNNLFGPGLVLTDHAMVAGMEGVSALKSAQRIERLSRMEGGPDLGEDEWKGIVEAFHVAVPSEKIMRLDGIGKSDPVATRFFNNLFSRRLQNENYEEVFGEDVVTLANSYFREALDEVAQWEQHGYQNFAEALEHFVGDVTKKLDFNDPRMFEGPARVANAYNGHNASWMLFTHMASMVATIRALKQVHAPITTSKALQARRLDPNWRTKDALIKQLEKGLDEVKKISESMYFGEGKAYKDILAGDYTSMREGGTRYINLTGATNVDISRIVEKTMPSTWNVLKGFQLGDITRGLRATVDVRAGGHISPEEFMTYPDLADEFFSIMVPGNADDAARMMLGQLSNGHLLNHWRIGERYLRSVGNESLHETTYINMKERLELRVLNALYKEANVEALTHIGGGDSGVPHRVAMLVGDENTINGNLVTRRNLNPEAPNAQIDTNLGLYEMPAQRRLPKRDKAGRFTKKTSAFSASQFNLNPNEVTQKIIDSVNKLNRIIRQQLEILKSKKILGSSRQGGAADVVDLNKKASKGDVVPNLDVTDANIDPPIYKGKPTRWNNIVPRELDEVLASDPAEGLRLADGTITDEGNASIAVAIIRRMPELLEKSWELVKVNEEILAASRRRKAAIIASQAGRISDPRQLAIAQMGAMRGEMTALGFEPMSMDVKEFAALLSYAQQRLGERSFDVVNAKLALEKLTGHSFDPSVEPGLAARHLTRTEIMLIERLFGFDIAALAATRSRQLRTREKILRALVDFLNIPRILLLGGDFGGLFNQGLLFAGRPKAYLKAAAEGLKSFAIPRNFEQAMRDIEGHQHFAKFFSPPGVRSGVNGEGGYGAYFADLNSPLSLREEQFVSEYLRRIPGIGHIYKAFERFHVAFLNKLRFDMMQSAYLVFKNSGAKQADIDRQMRTYADWVNKGTGRGNIWKANELTAGLNTIFLAPRWVVSRFQVPVAVAKELGSYSINRTTGRPVKNNLVAKQIAKDMVGFATVIGGIATLLSLNGFQVGTDHRKSDFLKLTKGRTNIDLTAGMGSVFRFIFRAGSVSLQGATEGEPFRGKLLSATGVPYDKNLWDISSDFLNMKFSPAVRTVDTLVTGKNFYGEDIDAERSFLPTDLKTLQEWAPLWIQEVTDAAEQLGTSSAASLLIPSLAGLNVAIYPDKNDLALEALGRNYTEAWPFEQESIDMLYYEESRFSPSEYSENNYALNSLFLDEMEKVLSNPNISDTQKSYQISKRYHDLNKEKRGIRLQAFGPDDQGREDEYPLRVAQQEFYEYKDSLYDPAIFAGSNSAYEYAELLEQIYLDGLTEIEREYILANMYMLPLPMELLDLKTTTGESPGWVKRVTQAREIQAKVVRRHGLEAAPFDPSLYEETREMQRNIGGETYAQEVAIAN